MYCTRFIVYLEETTLHQLQTFSVGYLGRLQQFYVKKSFFINVPIRVIFQNSVTIYVLSSLHN